ncbi:hypothetical protein HDK77DRAFT_478509 [Phyllosticta capitalensis]|uniref:F-box domain-containing protein n=1 Tax=Phyllosticta capitalensis TaxID=121624 RepID=A0ABR1Z001_9PEZI
MDLDPTEPLPSAGEATSVGLRRTATDASPDLLGIPLELQLEIASYLESSSIGRLRATCRQLDYNFYDLFIKHFLHSRQYDLWRTSESPCLEIYWTENGLHWANFLLSIKNLSKDVRELVFKVGFDVSFREIGRSTTRTQFRYPGEDTQREMNIVDKRKEMIERKWRVAELLESIWMSTPRVKSVRIICECDFPETHRFETHESTGLRFAQALTLLTDQITTIDKGIEALDIKSPPGIVIDSKWDTIDYDPTRVFSNLDKVSEKLLKVTFFAKTIDSNYWENAVKGPDRFSPCLSSYFGAMTHVEELTLQATTEDDAMTPKFVHSILSTFSSTSLRSLRLESLIIRQSTLAKFLSVRGQRLQELYLDKIFLVHGG